MYLCAWACKTGTQTSSTLVGTGTCVSSSFLFVYRSGINKNDVCHGDEYYLRYVSSLTFDFSIEFSIDPEHCCDNQKAKRPNGIYFWIFFTDHADWLQLQCIVVEQRKPAKDYDVIQWTAAYQTINILQRNTGYLRIYLYWVIWYDMPYSWNVIVVCFICCSSIMLLIAVVFCREVTKIYVHFFHSVATTVLWRAILLYASNQTINSAP